MLRRPTVTVETLFGLCDLCLHPGFESFVYWPIGGTSDLHWLRWDANDASESRCGIQMLDGFEWLPLEECAGVTKGEIELLHGQIPNAIPLNSVPITKANEDNLPGFVYDIYVGRFRSVNDAKSEENADV